MEEEEEKKERKFVIMGGVGLAKEFDDLHLYQGLTEEDIDKIVLELKAGGVTPHSYQEACDRVEREAKFSETIINDMHIKVEKAPWDAGYYNFEKLKACDYVPEDYPTKGEIKLLREGGEYGVPNRKERSKVLDKRARNRKKRKRKKRK